MRKGYQVSWWLALSALLLIQVPVSVLVLKYPNINSYLASFIGECFLILPILAGWLILKRSGQSADLCLTKYNFRKTGYYIFMPIALSRLIIFLTIPLNLLLTILMGEQGDLESIQSFGEGVLAILTLCVAAPILEELLCRGVIMKMLEPYGTVAQILISAFIFSMMHMDVRVAVPIFFLGALFGVIRLMTGSLVPCIVMHAAFNFTSFFTTELMNLNKPWINGLITQSVFIMAVVAPILLWRYFTKTPMETGFKMQRKMQIGVSVGFIIFVVLIALFNGALMIQWLVSGGPMSLFQPEYMEI